MDRKQEGSKSVASVTGGVSPRPGAKITARDPSPITFNDPEIDSLDLAYLSAKETEEEWGPDFFLKKQDAHTEFAQSNNKHITVAMTTGHYKKDKNGVPVWSARLQCGTCKTDWIFDNWSQMNAQCPEECAHGDGPNSDCPLYHRKLKDGIEERGY